MRDKKGGFPSFLRNKFVGNSREQLLIGLEHANVLTQQEIKEAVHLSQLIPEITPKLWRVTCDMEVKLCGANLVCVGVWFGRAVELEVIITAWVLTRDKLWFPRARPTFELVVRLRWWSEVFADGLGFASVLVEVKLCRASRVCMWVAPQVSKLREKEEQRVINICVGACDKLWFLYYSLVN